MAKQKDKPKIQIAVAAHKACDMPQGDIYLPLQVGAELRPNLDLGFQKDNEGDNISALNGSYCELTALYWMWKNCDADWKGLVHYRRFFETSDSERAKSQNRMDRVASEDDFLTLIDAGAQAILPKKRNYYIESVYSHYSHTFDAAHFDAAHDVLSERCPEYVPAWDELMLGKTAWLYNMFVMSAENVDAYCRWLFPLLLELEERIDSSELSAFHARWVGRVAERLFNCWLQTNKIKVMELPTTTPEPVNWPKKASSFLAAKFLGKKYESSF